MDAGVPVSQSCSSLIRKSTTVNSGLPKVSVVATQALCNCIVPVNVETLGCGALGHEDKLVCSLQLKKNGSNLI